jgi:hypothetical protein
VRHEEFALLREEQNQKPDESFNKGVIDNDPNFERKLDLVTAGARLFLMFLAFHDFTSQHAPIPFSM